MAAISAQADAAALLFQSLFSWNLLLMSMVTELHRRSRHVSILVFVELALDDRGGREMTFKLLFQSLFSWNLLLMSGILMVPGCTWGSFNPCFRGTCS